MHPLLVIAIPLVLVMAGMMLNSIGLSFDQPPSSPEQDPIKRLAAETQAYRSFFNQQRSLFLKRQKRIGQYGWLVLVVFIASFIWMYLDTVKKTTALNQIAAIQTLAAAEGKGEVLSVTLRDGSNVKYLVKYEEPSKEDDAAKEKLSKETVSAWEISNLGTAVSTGDSSLPFGIALTISN